ncbi:exodeoxyribonuclease VII small subunit, partial [bacterium 1XD42-8]
MSLEKAFASLENSINQLEAEDISLEESFKIYEEGMK